MTRFGRRLARAACSRRNTAPTPLALLAGGLPPLLELAPQQLVTVRRGRSVLLDAALRARHPPVSFPTRYERASPRHWQALHTKELDSMGALTESLAMSTVHFVGGEKGGVGKSVVARLLAQLFIERNLAFAALDADLSHGALVRYYADYTRAVDLTQLDSADQIMDSALGAERRVLVDLPAQSHRFLRRWVETADVLGYAREMNVRLVFWHVTDGGFDSVSHLEQLLALLGNAVQCVVVKNQGRSDDFTQFDASPAQQRLLELGGQVTTLPELDAAAMYKIDRFGSSFWAAINTAEGERALSPMERRRAKLWLERAHRALDQVGEWQASTEHTLLAPQPAVEALPSAWHNLAPS